MSSSDKNRDKNTCFCCCTPCKKGPEGGKAILKCGCGGTGPLALLTTSLAEPMPIVSVSIDTSGLENPTILLTFTTDINIPASVLAKLNFVVKKSCSNGNTIAIGPSHTFATQLEGTTILEAANFAFQICDCGSCGDCCTYTVFLAPASILSLPVGLSLNNSVLSILAVENKF